PPSDVQRPIIGIPYKCLEKATTDRSRKVAQCYLSLARAVLSCRANRETVDVTAFWTTSNGWVLSNAEGFTHPMMWTHNHTSKQKRVYTRDRLTIDRHASRQEDVDGLIH